MNPRAERRLEDLRRLSVLCARSLGRLAVESIAGDPPSGVVLAVHCATAGGPDFPGRAVERSVVQIHLPERYPFQPPVVEVRTPIFHPNVTPGGRICLGTKWLPTEGLDLLAIRVARIVSFDPALINPSSPANAAANLWYAAARIAFPTAFPTVSWDYLLQNAEAAKSRWRNL